MGFFLEFNVGPLGWLGFVLNLGLDIGVAGAVHFVVSVRSIVE